ncbi:MAG: DUF2892 domain-containing protein [Cytophagaceae bacterium]|nr:DUF2892 domain-containing protein [Cytophagaceae bacterium]
MIKNMGGFDRISRTIIALVIIALFFNHIISGTLGIMLIILSVVFIATSFMSFCPLYTFFNFSSKSKKSE